MKLYYSPGACSLSPHMGVALSSLPHLMAYMDRVATRPAVQAAMKAEGLLK